jgi:outer membrane protein assembly factor BamB
MSHKIRYWLSGSLLLAAVGLAIGTVTGLSEDSADSAAKTLPVKMMLASLSDRAGFVVHLGVRDGKTAIALSDGGRLLVHGLATNDEAVEQARATIRENKLTGVVSIERLQSRLPYADNLVNLLLADNRDEARRSIKQLADIVRVLRPGGTAFLRGDEKAITTQAAAAKVSVAVSGTTDGWVKVVKTRPDTMDAWTHRKHDPSGNPVSTDKQVGVPTGVRWVAGPNWPTGYRKSAVPGVVASEDRLVYVFEDEVVTAGKPTLQNSLIARDAYNGMFLWKRKSEAPVPTPLVSVGERVYTVLAKDGPIVSLDAITGKTLRTYEDTDHASQLFHHVGRLIVRRNEDIRCFDANTGKAIWNRDGAVKQLLAGDGHIYIQAEGRTASGARESQLVSLDLASGKELWKAGVKSWAKGSSQKLILYQDNVLVLAGKGTHGVSAKNGKHLWSYTYSLIGHGGSFEKVVSMKALVWIHTASSNGTRQYAWEGLDPQTGSVKKRVIQPKDFPMKHRCSYDVATERYFLCGSMDFADLETGRYTHFSAARNSCRTAGAIPANGLIYTFPHACGCYPMLRGFMGLATTAVPTEPVKKSDTNRLLTGPAFGQTLNGVTDGADAWPTYRRDAKRTGSTTSPGPSKLDILWKHQVAAPLPTSLKAEWGLKDGGRLSAPVITGGTAFAASLDDHTLSAVDSKTGKPKWLATAAGRIDCPPTIHEGRCFFGSRDGWVYSVTADKGELIWKFRAAPAEQRILAHGQLESSWPVVGGVLVHDGLAYFLVGRHSGSDGGLFAYAVEPATGKLVWSRSIEGHDGVADLLTAEGDIVTMASVRLNAKTGKNETTSIASLRGGRLGLLSDAWYRRPIALRKNLQLWTVGGDRSGQMLSWASGGYCGFKACSSVSGGDGKLSGNAELFVRATGNKNLKPWSIKLSTKTRLRGLVLAGETVYAAGVFGEKDGPVNAVRAYSARDGKLIDELRLTSPFVHDCLAVANKNVYVTTEDGELICIGKK